MEEEFELAHFVVILSHFWDGCHTLAHENIFFKGVSWHVAICLTAEAPTACGGGGTPAPAAVRPRHSPQCRTLALLAHPARVQQQARSAILPVIFVPQVPS